MYCIHCFYLCQFFIHFLTSETLHYPWVSSVGGLCFIEGNSCCTVLRGLLQTFMSCFLRVLDRGSVIPLI